MGLLGFSIALDLGYEDAGYCSIRRSNLDFTKISNINVTVSGVQGPTQYVPYGVYVRLLGAVIADSGTHNIAPPYDVDWTYGVLALDRKLAYHGPNPCVTINSFTTVDGKVHTADNLNY